MENNMKSKHYFAAASMGEGFCNRFNYTNDNRRKGCLYIFKGEPDNGKSTLISKLGKRFEQAGEQIEWYSLRNRP